MTCDSNTSGSNPPIFSPANDRSALLFAALPCVAEPFRPLFLLLFLLSEFSARDFSLVSIPPLNFSSPELLNTVFPDKDTLLRSLSFYSSAFHTPLLGTLANLLKALQFYHTYKDLFSNLSAFTEGTDACNASGASADPFSGILSGLGGLSPEMLQGMMSMFSNTSAPASDAPSTQPPSHSEEVPIQPQASTLPETQTQTLAPTPQETQTQTQASTPHETQTQTQDSSDTSEDNPLFDSLYKMLTPEQQAIYEQLMQNTSDT